MAVANMAGVSTSTVSLVLSGKGASGRIPEETRERVRRAAEQLNYAPNLLTRSLRRGRTHILSFFSGFRHREWEDLYMDKVSAAISLAGGELGYDILVHCNFARGPREVYQFLNGGYADGVILFAPPADDPLLPLLRNSRLPVVLMNGHDPEGSFGAVQDDVEAGMRLVAQNLVSRGHERIAVVSSDSPDARDAADRVRRLRDELARLGRPVSDDLVFAERADEDRIVQRILALSAPPTAVFCWHDRAAYRFVTAAEAAGVRIPEELSVVGYDGLRWPSTTAHEVASVQVDIDGCARAAVQLLDRMVLGEAGPSTEFVFPVSFVEGTTLGVPPL